MGLKVQQAVALLALGLFLLTEGFSEPIPLIDAD